MRFHVLVSSLLLILFASCSDEPAGETPKAIGMELHGEAQGTTYTIKYLGDTLNYQSEIDSLLNRFDEDLSTWREGSLINRINAHNRSDTVFAFVDETKFFSAVFDLSREIYRSTDGAFDPTVLPLIRAWGFQLEKRQEMTAGKVDSLLAVIDFSPTGVDMTEYTQPDNEYLYEHTEIIKLNPLVELDFNAVAQGYSIDLIGDLLVDKGIEDFMVELGGEVYARGKSPSGEPWLIAIDKPVPGEREIQSTVLLDNKALATSGNYRKYYEEDGKRYSHIINPQTGYPAQNDLLSVTVLAGDCGRADAYATALMVMGRQAPDFLAKHPELGLEAYLIFDEDGQNQVVMTEGMIPLIRDVEGSTP